MLLTGTLKNVMYIDAKLFSNKMLELVTPHVKTQFKMYPVQYKYYIFEQSIYENSL